MHRKRVFTLLPALAVAAAIGVAAGCGGASESAAPAVTPSDQLAVTPQPQANVQGQPQVSSSVLATGDPYELIPAIVEQVQPSIVSVAVQTGQGGAQGSGVVWDSERGLVVTNHHVVEGAGAVQVQTSGGQRFDASVVATDPVTDLAVIRVDGADLPQAEFADELPRVGELAVAMGNPLGFENSVTAGIVSALHRSLGEAPFIDLIQTDAPISPGNSGGALVNRDGEVIGINSAGIPTSQNANSLGFAIPSPTVRSIVEQLIETGQASHPFVGITSTDTGDGIRIESVSEGSPAADAGLRPGDVIVAIDGTEVGSTDELVSELRSRRAGDVARVTLDRDGQPVDVPVTLGERPSLVS